MAEDGVSASVNNTALSIRYSRYVKSGGYSFTIPPESVIRGVTATAIRSSNAPNMATEKSVRVVKAGVTGSKDLASVDFPPPDWGISPASWGSQSELWDDTLTADDINDGGIGYSIRVSVDGVISGANYAYLDGMKMTVYYNTSGGGLVQYFNNQHPLTYHQPLP